MVVVKLSGGIGNQMFQYAFARKIAHENNTELKLDLSWYEIFTNRNYGLDEFNIKARNTTEKEVKKYDCVERNQNNFINILNKISNVLKKNKYIMNDRYFYINKDIYITGYWQSEKYFSPIESIIRNDFTFRKTPNDKNNKIIDLIDASQAVSIHIRRGDYVSDKKTRSILGLLPIEYYRKCIDIISEVVSNPNFFIFSDDQQWSKDYLNIDFPTIFVENNYKESHCEDLRLISLCKHNIIANSTFSWWGAWLNKNKNKIVLAPKRWFISKKRSSKEILPSRWWKI